MITQSNKISDLIENTESSVIVLLSSDEAELLRSTVQMLQKVFKNRDKNTEVHKFNITSSADWQSLYPAYSNPSLFSTKQLLIIDASQYRVDSEGQAFIQHCCGHPLADIDVVILTSKLASKDKNSKWFKALDQHGIVCLIQSLTTQGLQSWLKQLARSHGLTCPPEMYHVIAAHTENNLPAARSCIEKLALQFGSNSFTMTEAAPFIENAIETDVYHLMQHCLMGKINKIPNLFASFLAQNEQPHLLLWLITRDLLILRELKSTTQNKPIYQEHGIWQSRQIQYEMALKRSTVTMITQWLEVIKSIDGQSKGTQNHDVMQQIYLLLICITQGQPHPLHEVGTNDGY